MLFVARLLHFPDGRILRSRVVSILDGFVNEIYCFRGEVHSMSLVDDMYLSVDDSLNNVADIRKISHLDEGEKFYAYLSNEAGELTLIKD